MTADTQKPLSPEAAPMPAYLSFAEELKRRHEDDGETVTDEDLARAAMLHGSIVDPLLADLRAAKAHAADLQGEIARLTEERDRAHEELSEIVLEAEHSGLPILMRCTPDLPRVVQGLVEAEQERDAAKLLADHRHEEHERALVEAQKLRAVIRQVRLRIHFIGWPAEAMWEGRPDWRAEIAAIESALFPGAAAGPAPADPPPCPEYISSAPPYTDAPCLGCGKVHGPREYPR